MTVSEEPQKADAVLARPDGKVEKLSSRIVGSTINVRLPASGPRGAYTLSYRVVSADGHPISGSAKFTVTAGPTPSAPPAPSSSKEPARGPLVSIVIVVAIVGAAATVFAARAARR